MREAENIVTYKELCAIVGIHEDDVFEIVEYDIVQPLKPNEVTHWEFDVASIHWIKRALRLREDFQIDWIAVALIIDLLRQNEHLRKDNVTFKRQLKRLMKNDTY